MATWPRKLTATQLLTIYSPLSHLKVNVDANPVNNLFWRLCCYNNKGNKQNIN